MSFPWQTEKERRKQQADEDSARRAVADFHEQYRGAVDRINRATDREIDEAMAKILRKQAERPIGIKPGKRLKPARSDALEKERGDG